MEFDEIVVKESPGLCRCCLSEGCYKDMGTEYTWMNENEVYADMLLECFDISISQHNEGPNGPNRLICEVCITRLRDACNFKKQVLDSEKKFVDMLGRGEFRPKLLIYQSQMKSEATEEMAGEETEVEYLEDMDFGDADDEPLKAEASSSEIAVEALPVAKRGRPRKGLKVEKKKAKHEERPKTSKAVVKEEDPKLDKALQRQRKLDMAMLLKIIILKSTAMPFRWHECKYMCFYCNDHFIESSKLKEHIVKHPDVDIQEIMLRTVYKPQRIKLDIAQNWCTECSAEFDSFNDYIQHLFFCQNKEFDPEVVGRFEVFKLADDDMKCLECGMNFMHFGPLLNHTHQCHVNAEQNFRFLCEICGQGFCNKGSVDTHIKQSHFAQNCVYCTETFQTRYAVDKHVALMHKIEKLQCPLCPDILPNRYQKKRHLAFKHDVKSVQLVCYICNKVFTRNNKLMMHIRRVHLKEKNVTCDLCGMLFFGANELKKHKLTHSNEMSFQCGFCQKIFRRKTGLVMHLTQIHGSDVSE